MYGKHQLEMLMRLPKWIKKYEEIIADYEGYNFKTKFINYLLEKYFGKKYGRNAKLYEQTGITENHLKNIRHPYISQEEGTLFLFAFGLGLSFKEALVLASECNIVWYGNNDNAEAIFSTLLKLKDREFMQKDAWTRINDANVYYTSVAKDMLEWKAQKAKADAERKEKRNRKS